MSTYISCFACFKEESCEDSTSSGLEAWKQKLYIQGWRRRSFCDSSRDQVIWFCSSECAYHSPAALKAEEMANKHFKEYCRQTPIPSKLWIPISLVMCFIIILILKGCLSA